MRQESFSERMAPPAPASREAIPQVPSRSFDPPSLLERAVSVGMWSAGLSWLVPTLGSMTLIYKVVPPHRVNILGRLYCKGQIALTGAKWRAVVHPDVDPGRPYVFMQNHTNHFDHVMLYNATPHFKQGLELESHFNYPVYGWFMKARGTIPVRPGERGRTSSLVRGMKRELDAGRSVLAFPEGHRTRTGRVLDFRRGLFYAAQSLGATIVPVAVTGSFDLMRPGSLMIRPGADITVYCEKPVPTAGLSEEDVPALAEQVQATIARRVDAYWSAQAQEANR